MAQENIFDPLSTHRSIRILILHPSPRDSALEGFLHEVSIDDNVGYEALSYAWGDVDTTGRTCITCSEKRIPITPNCSTALVHLRREDEPRALWVDAICIDQTSIQEKNHQIPLMGDIYRNAMHTLMWLGEGTLEAKETLKDILLLSARRVSEDAKSGNEEAEPIVEEIIQTFKSMPDAEYNKMLQRTLSRAKAHILDQPYFHRMWTIQEAALSQSPEIVVGDRMLSWSSFMGVVDGNTFMDHLSGTPAGCHIHAQRIIEATQHVEAQWLTTSKATIYVSILLQAARSHGCRDKRDKVYALYSILNACLPGALPKPDYARPWTEVFTNIAVTIIDLEHGSLEFLKGAPSPHHALELPSWVPDWCDNQWFRWPTPPSPVLYKQTNNVIFDGLKLSTQSILIGYIEETEPDSSQLGKELLHRPAATSLVHGWMKSKNWSKILVQNLNFSAWLEHVPQHVFRELILRMGEGADWSLHAPDYSVWRGILTTEFKEIIDETDRFNPEGVAWHVNRPMQIPDQDWEVLGWSLLLAYHLLHDDRNPLLFSLDTGYLGFSVNALETGDLVAVLPGTHYPALLRPCQNKDGHSLIGFVWVFGVMDDEIECLGTFNRIKITIL
ncbi:heterokaryon incompatibility protein-domain-containing protein [Paraphoma chrysanthemicola]|nr:heterokaryon incompatibility protein-domain-containing protein [Paraphoma chrysanthemicola]